MNLHRNQIKGSDGPSQGDFLNTMVEAAQRDLFMALLQPVVVVVTPERTWRGAMCFGHTEEEVIAQAERDMQVPVEWF